MWTPNRRLGGAARRVDVECRQVSQRVDVGWFDNSHKSREPSRGAHDRTRHSSDQPQLFLLLLPSPELSSLHALAERGTCGGASRPPRRSRASRVLHGSPPPSARSSTCV